MNQTKRTHYRHGNIPTAALQAARTLLSAGGIGAVTVRKITSKIDVTPRALYNHFENLSAVFTSISAQGFAELAIALQIQSTKQGFRDTYITFALENPHLYQLMMSQSSAQTQTHPDLSHAVQHVIAHSLKIFGLASRTSEENKHHVMREWMHLHGGISLHQNGILTLRTDAEFIEDMKVIAVLEN